MNHSLLSRALQSSSQAGCLRSARTDVLVLCVAALTLALTGRLWTLATSHERLLLSVLSSALAACSLMAAVPVAVHWWRELRGGVRRRLLSSFPNASPEGPDRGPRPPRSRWSRHRRSPPREAVSGEFLDAREGCATYQTPYPFSVWSYHDNMPEFEVIPQRRPRGVLWATGFLLACFTLAAVLWWGYAVAQFWAALA